MQPDLTQLLVAWQSGDAAAFEAVTGLVYDELRRLAGSYLRKERKDHTLQPTALVNEAYLKLVGISDKNWHSRAQFFAIAAHIMRQLLVEHARSVGAKKRGGDVVMVPVEDSFAAAAQAPVDDVLWLDEALTQLALVDERKSRIVELRYFGGLEIAEIAEVTSTSEATVGRDLRIGLAWLKRYLGGGKAATV